VLYAAVSLNLYNRDPATVNPDSLARAYEAAYVPYPPMPNTHFQASFGHLDGYSAVYYTYLWSLVIAKDLFSQFDHEHLLDPKIATKYRRLVLEPGGSKPAAQLVHDFLGRDFQYEAVREVSEGRGLRKRRVRARREGYRFALRSTRSGREDFLVEPGGVERAVEIGQDDLLGRLEVRRDEAQDPVAEVHQLASGGACRDRLLERLATPHDQPVLVSRHFRHARPLAARPVRGGIQRVLLGTSMRDHLAVDEVDDFPREGELAEGSGFVQFFDPFAQRVHGAEQSRVFHAQRVRGTFRGGGHAPVGAFRAWWLVMRGAFFLFRLVLSTRLLRVPRGVT
jgi:hypothetical protein